MPTTSDDIAIIGMGCLYPGASSIDRFWENILANVDAVSDAPEGFGYEECYDPDSTQNDRIYCKRGGFLEKKIMFNPIEFGIMPGSIDGSSPEQFLALKLARDTLEDAGYLKRDFDRQRVGVILGHGLIIERGQATWIQHCFVVRQTLRIIKRLHPEISKEQLESIKQQLKASLPPFNPDTCPGLISNVLTGRIANCLDLQGPNYTVDAACASSLIAVDCGIRELLTGNCEMVIVGGVQASTSPQVFMVFCQLGALSKKGRVRPFDKDADGTLLGEGIGMMAIKRRKDAERDGDRIYALIKGIGVASDGKGQGLLVPRVEGQVLALERAYRLTGVPRETVTLIEAHGTGTTVGDAAELETIDRIYGKRNGDLPIIAMGTVKSNISHTIPAAGMAGMIKTALALYHKILPPTLCDTPSERFRTGKLAVYINTRTRPWIHGQPYPRRAGINAFGFGGINSHGILEEYPHPYSGDDHKAPLQTWDSEVFLLQAADKPSLAQAGSRLLGFLSENPDTELRDIAYTLNCATVSGHSSRLAIVAGSKDELCKKLRYAAARLTGTECRVIKERKGIFYFENPLGKEGRLAFIFPGEGAQYLNMLCDLCVHFPDVRSAFDYVDRLFIASHRRPLPSQVLFPAPTLSADSLKNLEQTLWRFEYATNTVFAANYGIYRLLAKLNIRPHAVVGHSYGDDAALVAAGIVEGQSDSRLEKFSHQLKVFRNEDVPTARLMTVGAAQPNAIETIIREIDGELFVAMDNCPNQVVLCGTDAAISEAHAKLTQKGAICSYLPFDRAYHTPWYQPVCDRQVKPLIEDIAVQPPKVKIYSCATAAPYPDVPEKIRQQMVDQWALPVRFRETIETMYNDGVRIFAEVGPRGNLTSFVEDILRNRRHVAVPSNLQTKSGLKQINLMLALLSAHHVPMTLDSLYKPRRCRKLAIFDLRQDGFGHKNQNGEKDKRVRGSIAISLAIPRMELSAGLTNETQLSRMTLDGQASSPAQNDGSNIHQTLGQPVKPQDDLATSPVDPFRDIENKHRRDMWEAENTGTHLSSSNDEKRKVLMGAYFENMQRFLDSQKEIMEMYLAKCKPDRSQLGSKKQSDE